VPNEGDAWQYTLDEVERYFERAVIRQRDVGRPAPLAAKSVIALTEEALPAEAQTLVGGFLEAARLIGQRVAELHLALAASRDDPAFAPEPFTKLYQRSLYQSMRNSASRSFRLLDERLALLPAPAAELGRRVLTTQARVLRALRGIVDRRIIAQRIRCHGDLHLGQVLYTGKDFFISDFEGEPARPLSERRIKRSPLRDIAGMLRSFDYATRTTIATRVAGALVKPEDLPSLEPWAEYWRAWVSSAFVKAYLKTAAGSPILPAAREDLAAMLQVYLLEKAVYELAYELNNRPDWVMIPLAAILQLIGPAEA
jgi:maltose alpha-D-glucosyltransferase/alpha-amylase